MSIEGVTFEQLRTLRAVAAAGSFSAAARQLGRVQAAVSQSIDRLEAQLDLRLFDRTGRVPRLTSHGEAIVAAAAKVGADIDALDELVGNLKRGAETTLQIVVDVLFPTESLVAFAKDFARVHPDVQLVLFTEILSAVTAHVRDRHAAWGIAIEDADLDGLDRRDIADVRLIPVAAREHPLAMSCNEADRAGAIDAATLNDSVQIVLGEHRHEAARGDDDHGVFSARTWRVVDLATKQALIAGGLGWGHMPEHLIRDDLRTGRLVELPLEAWGAVAPRRKLVLVWRRHAVMGPVARWAQDHLSDLCRRAVGAAPPANHAG
jgi:DNA-binding transcriptional LysR family regulator